jgi:NADH-quinone oxidoreductase subunit A
MQADVVLPILLFVICVSGLALLLLILGNLFNPGRTTDVKLMPYESGMDPVHDTRRRFDVRFHLLAIAFLVFDVELLFLYPWAVVLRPAASEVPQATAAMPVTAGATVDRAPAQPSAPVAVRPLFAGGMLFAVLLILGLVYDWRKGIFHWR